MNKSFTLRFLPLFEQDLTDIVKYISDTLQNPSAAERLVTDVENAIQDRLANADAFEPYHSALEHPYPYYCIRVRNYSIFYVVLDNVMEVRRIVYSRRDLSKLI